MNLIKFVSSRAQPASANTLPENFFEDHIHSVKVTSFYVQAPPKAANSTRRPRTATNNQSKPSSLFRSFSGKPSGSKTNVSGKKQSGLMVMENEEGQDIDEKSGKSDRTPNHNKSFHKGTLTGDEVDEEMQMEMSVDGNLNASFTSPTVTGLMNTKTGKSSGPKTTTKKKSLVTGASTKMRRMLKLKPLPAIQEGQNIGDDIEEGNENEANLNVKIQRLKSGEGTQSQATLNNSFRKSVSRKLSNISFINNLSGLGAGLGLPLAPREVVIFEVEVSGEKGSYVLKKTHRDFKKLNDALKTKFPNLKTLIKSFPKVGYFSKLPDMAKLEEHHKFFQGYLDLLLKLKPRPSDLNVFLDIRKHIQELKGKKRNGFNSLEDFELIKRIGEGSFGTVFLVKAIETDEIFAMKVLKKDELRKKHQVEHTMTEMKVMAISDHPFIVALKFAFHTEDRLFMVSAFCPGGELFNYLKKKRILPEEQVRFYSAEIALALSYLHDKHILYRDLKPENILMDGDGHVLLTDFGLSRENVYGDHDAKTFCGTPEYLSPEMLIHRETKEGYGKGVDWWSLGVLIFEMMFGLPPFYHKTLKKMCERILTKKLSFPEKKLPSSEEAKELIAGLLNRNVPKRLGVVGKGFLEIKNHPFYAGQSWDMIYNKEIETPFKPEVKDPMNVDNFDVEFTSKAAKLSVSSGKSKASKQTFATQNNATVKDTAPIVEDEFEQFDYSIFEKNEQQVMGLFYE